ncbi:MAG: non-heme ferritin [Acidobacteriota bacterium]
MISKKLIDRLNKQINLEFYSSNIYLQMSSWLDTNNMPGASKYLRQHAAEEMMHMNKLFDYVNESGGMAIVGAIKSPATEFSSVKEVFEEIYKHECYVTEQINSIVGMAFEDKDFFTFNFLQWFVAEQHEEESLFKSILDKFELIGDKKDRLFFIDQELARMAGEEAAAESGAE